MSAPITDEIWTFVDENREFVHIHEETEDGDERCIAMLDAELAKVWAVRLWEARKELEAVE